MPLLVDAGDEEDRLKSLGLLVSLAPILVASTSIPPGFSQNSIIKVDCRLDNNCI